MGRDPQQTWTLQDMDMLSELTGSASHRISESTLFVLHGHYNARSHKLLLYPCSLYNLKSSYTLDNLNVVVCSVIGNSSDWAHVQLGDSAPLRLP